MDQTSDGPEPRSRKRSFPVHGEMLKGLRLACGWSQTEAARRADVSERLIRKAEAGGPLESKTIAQLAMLYSAPQKRLEPEQIMVDPSALAGGPKPPATLQARVQRWFDGCWNHFNLDVIEELAIPDFEFHTESGVVRTAQELRARLLIFRQSFSDFDFVVEELLDLGSAVAIRWRVAMTHSGPWLDLPATGRRIVIRGSSWVQLVGDKFGDAWDFWDPAYIHQQLSDPPGK